jgi:hypothetical protein
MMLHSFHDFTFEDLTSADPDEKGVYIVKVKSRSEVSPNVMIKKQDNCYQALEFSYGIYNRPRGTLKQNWKLPYNLNRFSRWTTWKPKYIKRSVSGVFITPYGYVSNMGFTLLQLET